MYKQVIIARKDLNMSPGKLAAQVSHASMAFLSWTVRKNALGMKEGEDYFLIRDNCYTELTPEEVDENGVGRTLTCIGFRPMDAGVIDQIGKKYHLYT